MDYEPSTYHWAPFETYHFGGPQQTDAFRDLTWFTHGDQDPANYSAVWNSPSFTSDTGVTLAGHAGTSIGSYIKWGIIGTGNMPPSGLIVPIQAGLVTQALVEVNPITPKAQDAARVFTVSSSTPIDGLTNLVLQIRAGTIFPLSPDYTPFELAQLSAPVVLSLNSGSIYREWDLRNLTYAGVDHFSASYTQEVWSFQWDLSDVGVPITDFSIGWDSHPFGNVFGVQLDQSSVFALIPEPATMVLSLGALAFGFRRTRRSHDDVS